MRARLKRHHSLFIVGRGFLGSAMVHTFDLSRGKWGQSVNNVNRRPHIMLSNMFARKYAYGSSAHSQLADSTTGCIDTLVDGRHESIAAVEPESSQSWAQLVTHVLHIVIHNTIAVHTSTRASIAKHNMMMMMICPWTRRTNTARAQSRYATRTSARNKHIGVQLYKHVIIYCGKPMRMFNDVLSYSCCNKMIKLADSIRFKMLSDYDLL